MSIVDDLLQHVPLPKMVRVRQLFHTESIQNIEQVIAEEFRNPAIAGKIRPGARIAIGVGSRGLDQLPLLTARVVAELKQRGALPFIVPAMGSHGGATAAGQEELLATLEITEETVGCPIVSAMDTVELGRLENGLPVLMDRTAMQADGIIFINRIKPHTSFSGPFESGLVKMLAIGLGKQQGADSCHALGFGSMAENIVAMAKIKIARAPVLFGVASVENAYDKIARLKIIPAEEILTVEQELLSIARENMPRLLFNPLDVLVVEQMGKRFSGTGTDPHVTGRAATPYVKTKQRVNKMAILDLCPSSHGNATGVGLADICTRRLVEHIDFNVTYANHITSTELSHGKIPVTMDNDLRALQLAVKTSNCLDLAQLRMVCIANTLQLAEIRISTGLLEEARNNPAIEILGEPEEWNFGADFNLRTSP